MATAAPLVLITNKICPFAHRAWLALEESGVKYDLKETPLGHPSSGGAKPQWFTDIYRKAAGADLSSDGKVPVLEDGDFVLAESAIVADYVLAKLKPELLPSTPRERAEASLFVEQVQGKVVMGFYGALKATSADEETQAKTKDGWLAAIAGLSKALEKNGGPFFFGSKLTLPDLLVWPFILRATVLLKHYRGMEVPSEPSYAAYHKYVEAMRARDSVKATTMSDQFFVDGYKHYAYPTA